MFRWWCRCSIGKRCGNGQIIIGFRLRIAVGAGNGLRTGTSDHILHVSNEVAAAADIGHRVGITFIGLRFILGVAGWGSGRVPSLLSLRPVFNLLQPTTSLVRDSTTSPWAKRQQHWLFRQAK